jgi:hypothetical protein
VVLDAAMLNRSCALAVAKSDYSALHDAACRRIAAEQHIGTLLSNVRAYNCQELFRLCELADAELVAAGIHPDGGTA